MAVTVTDDLALLAFDEAKGVPFDRAGSALPHALAATLLFDLQAVGAVEIRERDEVVATGASPSDPLLAEAWRSIHEDRKVRTVGDWVTKSTRLVKGLPGSVYDHLAARGILAADGRTTIFHRTRYRELDERPERELVASLEGALDGTREATADELLLLALLPPCRLTGAVLPQRSSHATDKRIKQLLDGDAEAQDVARRVARAAAAGVAAVVAAGA